MTGEEILLISKVVPTSFIALSFKTDDTELKVKPKAPKSGKPSTKAEEKPKADFCKLKTTDKELARGLLFDINIDSFKQADANHTFIIGGIKVDDSIKDPKEMREKAIRKGKVIRMVEVDGNTFKEEKNFEA